MKLHSWGYARNLNNPIIARVATDISSVKDESVLFWSELRTPTNIDGYLAILTPQKSPDWSTDVPLVHSVSNLDYLAEGDVIQLTPQGSVRTLYRKNSHHNFILFTDQCNSYCLMCSQPPKPINDFHRMAEHYRLIDLIDPETRELGITGGEPTLFKDHFIHFVEHCRSKLPNTALHVLTNGRLFYYRRFAEQLGLVNHPDLMLGIPLYSDIDSEHDFVVQTKGAFQETVIGFHHLARYDIPIEIRVVIHKQTYRRLPQLSEYISRNFPFCAHVALMGLEQTGFTNQNMAELWIDPIEYQSELLSATEILALSGLRVSIYNHQLCVLDRSLWPYARSAISDWKNLYGQECERCVVRERCGGFFQSSVTNKSIGIRPIR
jgi:His-Xaa-Ser system radical SAM maturase HxsC